MEATTFFLGELAKLPPDRGFYVKGESAWLRCPFHAGGNESTPSFTVNLNPQKKVPLGFCGCFGCKFSAPWNALAQHFGLQKLTEEAVREGSHVLHDPSRSSRDVVLPDLSRMLHWPASVEWRGIRGDVVRASGGRTCKFREGFALYLPVTLFDEPVGGITALLEKPKDGGLSYFNAYGEWSGNALFGFDAARVMVGKPVWVCEGPRDTLNLHQLGQRAVGLIGAAVTPRKMALIAELDPPCILLATDADEAGDLAAAKLRAGMGKAFRVIRVRMRPGSDPADLRQRQVDNVNRQVAAKLNN